jgi:uncharacterized protein (TIGR03435 family)
MKQHAEAHSGIEGPSIGKSESSRRLTLTTKPACVRSNPPTWEASVIARNVLLGVLIATCGTVAAAQRIEVIENAKLPRFEVASVKPGDPNETSGSIGFPPGQFRQDNMPLLSAFLNAFGIRPSQLSPMPDFLLRERFTIVARMPTRAPPTDRPLMLRALLIDRFKLQFHIETKQEDAYALTLARRDGRLGPNMGRSTVDCASRVEAQRRNETVPPQPAGTKECGIRNGPGTIDFGGQQLPLLLQMLSNQAGRQVLDQTGLTGAFDVELHWSLASSGPLRATADGTAPVSDGPSLFTALEEQLGLKLESTKAPMDYLVFDHIERPQPD